MTEKTLRKSCVLRLSQKIEAMRQINEIDLYYFKSISNLTKGK
uniref:Uncharacterized protein n=1 Tax=Arundo donax TaxID=35708 RepID=A0A0A9DB20_ARUDO